MNCGKRGNQEERLSPLFEVFRDFPEFHDARLQSVAFHGDQVFDRMPLLAAGWVDGIHRRADESCQRASQILDGAHFVDSDMLQRTFGHRGVHGFLGVLHQDDSATVLDCPCARGSVVESAAQHDCNDPRTKR
jgi:hypothetical protein